MATYPYISGQQGVLATFMQLRKGFPAKVDAGYLQRFNLARGNESYIISILRFLGMIDEQGNRVESETDYFFGNDDSFKAGLEGTLRKAYSELFSEMGDGAMDADRGDLTHWFRASDKTSELVGGRQASTFLILAGLAGHGELPALRSGTAKKSASAPASAVKKAAVKKTTATKTTTPQTPHVTPVSSGDAKVENGHDVGLTVRIEVNLPPGGDADTYDAIFASIKKHLMS